MQDILVRAGCFVAIIVMGYLLRRMGFFQEKDFTLLSKIVLKITLPAAVISSFAGKEIDPSLLMIVLLGFGAGMLYVFLGFVTNLGRSKEVRAFSMLNTTGYNIGNLTMPFVQSFLGPVGTIVTSLFDTGNAFVCLGTSYGLASMVQDGKGFDFRRILKALIRSVPFDCYVIMAALNLMHIRLPGPVISFAGIIGNANAFLAMLMLGVGFNLSGDRSQIGAMVRILSVRYGVAVVLACAVYFLMPFAEEVRKTIVILMFSPISSSVPAFTQELKNDVGLAAAVNSVSIVISIPIIVILLTVLL